MNSPHRYVVLLHSGIAEPHYDLMIESAPDGLLATWRLTRWPASPDDPALPLKPHRRAYLTYEGPLSDDRGDVERVAEGRCTLEDGRVTFDDGSTMRLPA